MPKRTRRPPGRYPFIVSCIALKKDYFNADISGRSGLDVKEVSRRLRKESLDGQSFDQLLAGVDGTPAEVAAALACYEGLEPDPDLTDGERAILETAILERSRSDRAVLKEMALRSREIPRLDRYPEPSDVEPARWLARDQMSRLKGLTRHQRMGAVRMPEFHHWALCIEAAEESSRAASRDLKEAANWARVASEIADRVRGPEGWLNRLKGAALAMEANVLRVRGKLLEARAAIEKAKALWHAGSDSDQILDPGLLLDLEASLCRDERCFEDALDRLDKALMVGRRPERYLIKQGFTLEVMGEYERAVDALLKAKAWVDRQDDERLRNILHFNLAVNYCHAGRHREAAELVQQVRRIAVAMGDLLGVLRTTWLEGRIASGLGWAEEALRLLEEARGEFEAREMWYDVALALLEVAAVLLDQGRTAEVRAMTPSLARVFAAQGIHREALAALSLFRDAVESEAATGDLARRVLRFLFRARHDEGLRFSSC